MPGSANSTQLKVFLCHSSGDKTAVRELWSRLRADGFQPWLDEEELLPGQYWANEIPRAVRNSDIVIVCLSRASVSKIGFVQKEIKLALDVADMQPEGSIFLIPLKLEECDVPERLRDWQWVDYFEPDGHERLLRSLKHRTKYAPIDQASQTPQERHFARTEEIRALRSASLSNTKSERLGAFAFGACFLGAMLLIALRFPSPSPFQYTVFRVVLALSAAGVASLLPGSLRVEIPVSVRAGGAVAVFVIVYFLNPVQLLAPSPTPEKKTAISVSPATTPAYRPSSKVNPASVATTEEVASAPDLENIIVKCDPGCTTNTNFALKVSYGRVTNSSGVAMLGVLLPDSADLTSWWLTSSGGGQIFSGGGVPAYNSGDVFALLRIRANHPIDFNTFRRLSGDVGVGVTGYKVFAFFIGKTGANAASIGPITFSRFMGAQGFPAGTIFFAFLATNDSSRILDQSPLNALEVVQ